jgi:hypothetical protein
MAKNGWFRWQETLAAKKRKKRKIGMLFMCLLRFFAASPQAPNRVQSCHFYDFCAATMAVFAHFGLLGGKSMEIPLHEQFTRHTEFSSSNPIKPNQA